MTARNREVVVALAFGLTVALAAQLATGWAIRTDRVPLRDPPYLDKLAALRARPAFGPPPHSDRPLTVVFVGSSRTFAAVDASALGPTLSVRLGRPVEAFNFGTHGAGPVTCAIYLRRLLADGVKPDAVVIEVLPPLLAAQIEPPEARWLSVIRLRPDELPVVRGYGFPVQSPAAHGCRGWLLPWHEYRMPLVDRYARPLSLMPFPMGTRHRTDEYGFARAREIPPDTRARVLERTRREYAEYLDGYTPGGCGVAAVRDTLEMCRAAGVRAALLLAPESSEFRSWYPEPGRSRIVPLLAELGATVFDTREWLPDDQLGDGHHPTGRGPEVFTARLARDALGPWLTGGAP